MSTVSLEYNLGQGDGTDVWLDVCDRLDPLGGKIGGDPPKMVNPSNF